MCTHDQTTNTVHLCPRALGDYSLPMDNCVNSGESVEPKDTTTSRDTTP